MASAAGRDSSISADAAAKWDKLPCLTWNGYHTVAPFVWRLSPKSRWRVDLVQAAYCGVENTVWSTFAPWRTG